MNDLVIRKLENHEQVPWELLLLADPSREVIEKYLTGAEIYIGLIAKKVVGVYVLVKISEDIVELKNIAVDVNYQGQGIGGKLIMDALSKAKLLGAKKIEVGTGNSSTQQLALYKKYGFVVTKIDKGFFTRNYKEEIIENGIKCVDMIRLSQDL